MWKDFLKITSKHFLKNGLIFLFVGSWILLFKFAWIPVVVFLILLATYQASQDISGVFKRDYQEAIKKKEQAEKDCNLWKKTLIEKSSGFPTLLQFIEEYEITKDAKVEQLLRYKKHPSIKGAGVVKEEARRRRAAEFESKKTKAIIEYYESIAPFLLDFKDDIVGIEDEEHFRNYDEEERLDPVTSYLAKEEFRKLPSVERNQMALDRFWARPKSKWLLGRIYERYVGYLYENEGYDVEFTGIFKGYEDLGRDLICRKDSDSIVIQCKNWSQFKTIYEKHIFQFFGTVFQYKDENKNYKIRAIFYTTTQLSDLARRFAKELGIVMKENFKFDNNYPSIKCNISRVDGTKIYHLPFDQQYDNVKIEKDKGEFYCLTVKEAEGKGFRRAFRYTGIQKTA
jgi:hypothetical protein